MTLALPLSLYIYMITMGHGPFFWFAGFNLSFEQLLHLQKDIFGAGLNAA